MASNIRPRGPIMDILVGTKGRMASEPVSPIPQNQSPVRNPGVYGPGVREPLPRAERLGRAKPEDAFRYWKGPKGQKGA